MWEVLFVKRHKKGWLGRKGNPKFIKALKPPIQSLNLNIRYNDKKIT